MAPKAVALAANKGGRGQRGIMEEVLRWKLDGWSVEDAGAELTNLGYKKSRKSQLLSMFKEAPRAKAVPKPCAAPLKVALFFCYCTTVTATATATAAVIVTATATIRNGNPSY